jgi:hypothetical protein
MKEHNLKVPDIRAKIWMLGLWNLNKGSYLDREVEFLEEMKI